MSVAAIYISIPEDVMTKDKKDYIENYIKTDYSVQQLKNLGFSVVVLSDRETLFTLPLNEADIIHIQANTGKLPPHIAKDYMRDVSSLIKSQLHQAGIMNQIIVSNEDLRIEILPA